MKFWFTSASLPAVDAVGRQLALSGSSGGALSRLCKRLLRAEAQCADAMQATMKLRGVLEMDGTSVRHKRSSSIGSGLGFSSEQRVQRELALFDLGLATAKNWGKPPPESYAKITAVQALDMMEVRSGKRGHVSTLVVTDGAPCYPRLCKERRLLHRAVNHSKGEFSKIDRVGRSRVDIHTGGIDAIWKECKRAIPGNLAAGSPYIPLYMKAFQWRFCQKLSRNLLRDTGFALSSATV